MGKFVSATDVDTMKTIEFDPAQIESYAQNPRNAEQTIIRMKSGDTFCMLVARSCVAQWVAEAK
jgi:hypothetical protein